MAIATANLVISTFTMLDVFTKINDLSFLFSTQALTANNAANGAVTTGNTYLAGIFAADVGAFTTIRGGNVQSSNTLYVTSNVAFGNSLLSVQRITTSNTNPNQVLDTFSAASYRTSKYVLQVSCAIGYTSTEILLTHDGTNVSVVDYATLNTNTALGAVGSFSANISSNNVNLLFTPATAVTTVTLERRSLSV